MKILIVLGAVFAAAQSSSLGMIPLRKGTPSPVPVHVQFITQKDEFLLGDTRKTYHAALCGGCQFDGLMAHFAVNLVNNLWNDDKGDSIVVTAKDSHGVVLATNLLGVGNAPVPDFNFTYFSKYGDLYFNISTNSAPSFVYTLSLSFDYKQGALADQSLCTPRWQMTAVEYAIVLEHTKKNDVMGELVPIFKTEDQEQVETSELKYFRLDYCFGGKPHYSITISTIADDQQSGFASYACTKTYVAQKGKCDTKTQFKDISGGPANFVSVELNGPQDYGPVIVFIRGDGRFGLINHFTIAASAPK